MAEQALTVLARAWVHQAEAKRLITNALNADLAHLALPAARVTLQIRTDLGVLLEAALQNAPAPQDVLIQVANALPYPSVVLAHAHLAATQRVLKSLPYDAEPAMRGEWSGRTGAMLAQLGRPAEALTAEQEAVAIHRELAGADPDRYRSDLATSLSNLGSAFSDVGRPSEALPVTEEAVTIYRELTAANPDCYRPDLARSLSNLGLVFSKLGRLPQTLAVEREAVTIYRELAAPTPSATAPTSPPRCPVLAPISRNWDVQLRGWRQSEKPFRSASS